MNKHEIQEVAKQGLDKVVGHVKRVLEIGTVTDIALNEAMDLKRAHGVLTCKPYAGQEKNIRIPFIAIDPVTLMEPTESCIRKIFRQAFELGYYPVSMQLHIGERRRMPIMMKDYLIVVHRGQELNEHDTEYEEENFPTPCSFEKEVEWKDYSAEADLLWNEEVAPVV